MMNGDRAMMKAIATGSVALALLVVSCGGSSGPDANEVILRSLPQLPGAELLSVESAP
jgi:hypothetical protein